MKVSLKKRAVIDREFIVAGDSHVRAFSGNSNFFPVFLGQGKEHCFVNDQTTKTVKSKLKDFLSNIQKNPKLILVLGEPDTRFYLKKTWTPWDSPEVKELDPSQYFERLLESSQRFKEVVSFFGDVAELHILNVTPSERLTQNVGVNFFNGLISKWCQEYSIPFIEVNKSIYLENGLVDSQFMLDHVHCNSKLQNLVEQELRKMGKSVPSNVLEFDIEDSRLKEMFKFNERFGCFILDEKI